MAFSLFKINFESKKAYLLKDNRNLTEFDQKQTCILKHNPEIIANVVCIFVNKKAILQSVGLFGLINASSFSPFIIKCRLLFCLQNITGCSKYNVDEHMNYSVEDKHLHLFEN